MPELLIYSPQVTQRIDYIFQLFFDSLIPTEYAITGDEKKFREYEGPKLNYSDTRIGDNELQVVPWGLLTDKGISLQNIDISEWNSLKIFYRRDKGSLPFDIFSAAFFLVSRYEEYFSHNPDKHKRFRHNNSIAYINNFLDEPLVNLWAEELKKIILGKYPDSVFSGNKYSFIPTMDIDVAYAYLGRGILITIISYFRTIYKFKLKIAFEKKLVFLRLKKDPYDTYKYQQDIYAKYKLQPIYFFLAGRRGKYDKNISPVGWRFKRLVKRISLFGRIGIHPSYYSKSNAEILSREIKKVQQSTSEKITCSRQHFLKLNLPETYRCLAELGIADDYSMAYAGAVGFRASICTPFFFYDLKAEKTLPVKVHSSSMMDGTLNEYIKVTPDGAISIIHDIIDKVKNVNGEFIPIWHNHSISERGNWKGWRIVFETMMEQAIK